MIKEREKLPRGRTLSQSEMNYISKPERTAAKARKHFRHKPYGIGKGTEDGKDRF